MNILISRILTYLNGTLMFDVHYQFCLYIVNQYTKIEDITLTKIVNTTNFKKEDILAFCKLLGFPDFVQFKEVLVQDRMLRTDQIHARMLGVNSADLIHDSKLDIDMEYLSFMCALIHEAKRIILIGPLYPMSIAVEFQTDFITFGKPVIQYHHFDTQLQANKEDLLLYVSATGRSLYDFIEIKEKIKGANAKSFLFTQNKVFESKEHRITDYVLHIPGKFDGICFYHQIMLLLDAIRIHYYQQFYKS